MRISRNTDLMIIHDLMFDVNIVVGIGNSSAICNSSAISTSKIIKIIAIKKDRDEKGSRAVFPVSNPPSNGDFFPRSSLISLRLGLLML